MADEPSTTDAPHRVELERFQDGRWQFYVWLWGDHYIGSGKASSLSEAAAAADIVLSKGILSHDSTLPWRPLVEGETKIPTKYALFFASASKECQIAEWDGFGWRMSGSELPRTPFTHWIPLAELPL